MYSQMGFQIEVKTEFFVADFTLVWFFTSMDEHVAFKFGVVKKPFVTKFKRALELKLVIKICHAYKLVAMHCHVLFQRSAVVKNFSAGF